MGHIVSLAAADARSFDAFLESPERPNGLGIVLLPEVYNVNQWVRRVAARYAREGFTVLVPDLFWRQQPGCHYEYDHPDAARAQGEHVDVDAVVRDVGTAAARLRETLGAHARVGAVGYCLGGRLALLAGTREPVDAVVSYYGVKLDQHLDELARLSRPALLHFGDADPWVPNDVVHAVQARMAGLPNAAIHVYEGAGHAFDRDGQPTYRAQAADLAWRRTLALLASSLRTG
ncbi:MAG: dienelactone hydrolase family protein [Burkholderiaceae bacterium]